MYMYLQKKTCSVCTFVFALETQHNTCKINNVNKEENHTLYKLKKKMFFSQDLLSFMLRSYISEFTVRLMLQSLSYSPRSKPIKYYWMS